MTSGVLRRKMKTALIETIPTRPGDQFSWINFKLGRLKNASGIEKRLKLTVDMTDVISNFIAAARGIDKQCQISLISQKSFLFPDFEMKISGDDFSIEAEKVFAGGSSREMYLNYQLYIIIYAQSHERLEQLLDSYKLFGPVPQYSFKSDGDVPEIKNL